MKPDPLLLLFEPPLGLKTVAPNALPERLLLLLFPKVLLLLPKFTLNPLLLPLLLFWPKPPLF